MIATAVTVTRDDIERQMHRVALAVAVLDARPGPERWVAFDRLVTACGTEHEANRTLNPLIIAAALEARQEVVPS